MLTMVSACSVLREKFQFLHPDDVNGILGRGEHYMSAGLLPFLAHKNCQRGAVQVGTRCGKCLLRAELDPSMLKSGSSKTNVEKTLLGYHSIG